VRDGQTLGPREAPQRRLHGRALRAAFDGYVELLRALDGVTVELIGAEVIDVIPIPNGECTSFEVGLAGSSGTLSADRVLFVTGHSCNAPAAGSLAAALTAACTAPGEPARRFVRSAYPLELRLDEQAVPPGSRVGLLGLGLTAIDIALHLTEGRGGRFVASGASGKGRPAALAYVPSGREPATLVGVCPSGLPVSCRPDNAKAEAGTTLDHAPVFLTGAAIRTLRATVGLPAALPDGSVRRQLDFDRHVLPLLVVEMAWVFHRTALGSKAGTAMRAAAAPHACAFLRGDGGEGEEATERLLASLEAGTAPFQHADAERFDWRRAFTPLPPDASRDGASWRAAALDHISEDLAHAARDNIHDPFKAACDGVWRDLRGVLCEAVDRGGLTAASQRRFHAVHLRRYNRLSNGAALDPMRKLLALAQAGLLDLSVGPAPAIEPMPGASSFRIRGTATGTERDLDLLVQARTDPFHAARDERPLHPALLRRGQTRLWRNPGGTSEDYVPGALDLDERFHPREVLGRVDTRLTFLGAPAEGLMHFGQTAARPYAGNPVLEAVARWAQELVGEPATRRAHAAVPAAR
jgi:hypothetical protein